MKCRPATLTKNTGKKVRCSHTRGSWSYAESSGFRKYVQLYVASGEVYGGDETLASLKALFPNLHSKEALANKRELAPFSSSSSRMAAPDFIVCDEGDVFFYQQQWKLNMPQILAGQRYLCIFFSLVLCILVYSKAIRRTFQTGEELFLLKIFTCFLVFVFK